MTTDLRKQLQEEFIKDNALRKVYDFNSQYTQWLENKLLAFTGKPIILEQESHLFTSANEIDVVCIGFRNIIESFRDKPYTRDVVGQLHIAINSFLTKNGITFNYTIKFDELKQSFNFNGATRTDQLVLMVLWN